MLSSGQQPIGKDAENRIEANGDHGRHVKRFANASIARLAKPGTPVNGRSRAPLTRRKSGKRGDGLGRLEPVKMRDFRKYGSRRRFSDSGNRGQEFAPALELGIIVEVLSNLPLELRDLCVERGNDLPNRGRDDG